MLKECTSAEDLPASFSSSPNSEKQTPLECSSKSSGTTYPTTSELQPTPVALSPGEFSETAFEQMPILNYHGVASSLDLSPSSYSTATAVNDLQHSIDSHTNNNMCLPGFDYGIVHSDPSRFPRETQSLQSVNNLTHYCDEACAVYPPPEDSHRVNESFGMIQISKPMSNGSASFTMVPVYESPSPVVLELMTRSKPTDSMDPTVIESPISSHALPLRPTFDSSRANYLIAHSSTEFSASHNHQEYYYNTDPIGHITTEQKVVRDSAVEMPMFSDSTPSQQNTVDTMLPASILP